MSLCKKLLKMKHLTIYLLCLLMSPVYAQKSYRNTLNKDLNIQKKSAADFYRANNAQEANNFAKTINRFYWDESQRDWILNNFATIKYLSSGETKEVVEYDAKGQALTKSTNFKSADGRVSGNILENFIDGAWVNFVKAELEKDEKNNEIRNESFTWVNGRWEIVSGNKTIVEKQSPNERIEITYLFDEHSKKYAPYRRTITSFNNNLMEQSVYQEYIQNSWVNMYAEGYDYDHQQKISAIYYLTWDGVMFQNDELYTNITWYDYSNGKFSQMELKKWNGSNWENAQKAVYQYSMNNSFIGITFEYKDNEWVYSYRISEEYDKQNNPKMYKIENYTENNWAILLESRTDYTYDSENRFIESITKIFDGIKWNNVSKETVDYNKSLGMNLTKLSLNVYPNPSTNYFQVSTTSTDAAELTIYSIAGQMALQVNTANLSSEKIDVSTLQNGIYVVEIKQGQNVYTSKLLKN